MDSPTATPSTPPPVRKEESLLSRWWRPAISSVIVVGLLVYVLMPRGPVKEAPTHNSKFFSDFDASRIDSCLPEGSQFDDWQFAFAGFGCNSISEYDGERWIHLAPQGSQTKEESHSGMVTGQSHGSTLTLSCDVVTMRQLRKGTPPNPWETGWIVWGYRDLKHFYYFTVKTNGWELGKRDPAYPGNQKFLASGTDIKASLQQKNQVLIVQQGPTIFVSVDGKPVASVTDSERPYLYGRVGVYCEDADALFGAVTVERY